MLHVAMLQCNTYAQNLLQTRILLIFADNKMYNPVHYIITSVAVTVPILNIYGAYIPIYAPLIINIYW